MSAQHTPTLAESHLRLVNALKGLVAEVRLINDYKAQAAIVIARAALADAEHIGPVGESHSPDRGRRADEFATWRDEQIQTLRHLFRRQVDALTPYQSFPDFCRAQWEKVQ